MLAIGTRVRFRFAINEAVHYTATVIAADHTRKYPYMVHIDSYPLDIDDRGYSDRDLEEL